MVEEIFLDSLLGAQDDAEAEDVKLFLPDCPSRASRRGSALALHCGIHILTLSCLHVRLGTLCVCSAQESIRSLELERQAAVSHHVGAKIRRAEAPGRAASAANP